VNDRTAFRSTAALTVALVLVALLALVIVDPGRFSSVLNFGPASASADGGDPAAKPVPELVPPTIDPAHPFAGSPAADYPAGVAGLRMPAAKQIGEFSAKEVAQALDLAKRYFAATRLDPKVIAGQYPTGVFALLDPWGRETLDGLRQRLRSPTETDDPTSYVTRFDPREDVLHGSVIKVAGTATLRLDARDNLVVSLDSVVVYAVRRVDGPPEVTRVVFREHQDFNTFHGMGTTPGKVWLGATRVQWSGIDCAAASSGYVHPQYPSEWREDVGPSGEDPYDTREPLTPDDPGCEKGGVSRI
jgi:hypothetical protein